MEPLLNLLFWAPFSEYDQYSTTKKWIENITLLLIFGPFLFCWWRDCGIFLWNNFPRSFTVGAFTSVIDRSVSFVNSTLKRILMMMTNAMKEILWPREIKLWVSQWPCWQVRMMISLIIMNISPLQGLYPSLMIIDKKVSKNILQTTKNVLQITKIILATLSPAPSSLVDHHHQDIWLNKRKSMATKTKSADFQQSTNWKWVIALGEDRGRRC